MQNRRLDCPRATANVAQFWIGIVFLIAAVTAMVKWKAPSQYWRDVALLTPAVVLLGSTGADSFAIDGQWLLFTLGGAALALATTVAAWLAIHTRGAAVSHGGH